MLGTALPDQSWSATRLAALQGGRAAGVPAVISAALLVTSLVAIIRRLVGHVRVSTQTLLGSMCCYVLFGLIVTFAFAAVARLEGFPFLAPPSAGSLSDDPFFSFTTLTTTGSGNLIPVTGPGRALAMLEASPASCISSPSSRGSSRCGRPPAPAAEAQPARRDDQLGGVAAPRSGWGSRSGADAGLRTLEREARPIGTGPRLHPPTPRRARGHRGARLAPATRCGGGR